MVHGVNIPLKVRMVKLVLFVRHMHSGRILGILRRTKSLLHIVRIAIRILTDLDAAERLATFIEHVAPVIVQWTLWLRRNARRRP